MSLFQTFWYQKLGRPIPLKKSIDKGRGKKLVCIHGIADDGKVWQPLAKQADPKRWRVIAPDLLGFGDSLKPEWNEYSVDEHVRSVRASLKIRRGEQITLIGHSMGCIIATHFAHSYPELIEHLVLYEPAFLNKDEKKRSLFDYSKIYKNTFSHIMQNPRLASIYMHLGKRSLFVTGLSEASIAKQPWVPFEKSLENTILSQNSVAELSKLRVPVDIIYGRLDIMVSKSNIDKVLSRQSNIKFHTVTDLHNVSKRSARYILSLLDDK